MNFKERVLNCKDGSGANFDLAYAEWRGFILETLGFQKMAKIFKILEMNDEIKAVYLFGVYDDGKSSLIKLLQSVYSKSEVGHMIPLDLVLNSFLKHLVNKKLAIFEGILIMDDNLDIMMRVLDGKRQVYKNKEILPMPVLISSDLEMSNSPDFVKDIFKNCFKVPFGKRTYRKLIYADELMKSILKKLYAEVCKQEADSSSACLP